MPGYWLVKTEPGCYSIDDLKHDGTTPWTGIRNYQARNFMRDQMQVGDKVIVYHSSAEPPAAVGIAEVASSPYADPTAFDPSDDHFDPKSDPNKPTWMLVDLQFVAKFDRQVSLQEIKQAPELEGMLVARTGMRLSVQPVEERHFNHLVRMGTAAQG